MSRRTLIVAAAVTWVSAALALATSTRTFSGTALLDVDYDSGRVTAVHLVQSTGDPKMDAAMISSLSKWSMKPHRVRHVKVPFQFHLRDGKLESIPRK